MFDYQWKLAECGSLTVCSKHAFVEYLQTDVNSFGICPVCSATRFSPLTYKHSSRVPKKIKTRLCPIWVVLDDRHTYIHTYINLYTYIYIYIYTYTTRPTRITQSRMPEVQTPDWGVDQGALWRSLDKDLARDAWPTTCYVHIALSGIENSGYAWMCLFL